MAYKQLKLWFDEELASSLADKIILIDSKFSKKEFIGKVKYKINTLELKDRIEVFADAIFELLPGHYEEKIAVLQAIEEITKRNTGEYSIRPFIEMYQDKTIKVMQTWAKSENKHLRRLASEGIRIRLPWAKKFTQFSEDPSPIFDIIEILKDDKSKYVQKSVANSLNDVLKENYNAAIKVIKQWAKEPTKQRKWIIKHALRNQIKANNKEAVELISSF